MSSPDPVPETHGHAGSRQEPGTRPLLLAEPARPAGTRSAVAAVRQGAFRLACRVRKRPRCSVCSTAKTRTSGTGISGAARRTTPSWWKSWTWCARSMTGAPTAIDWRVGRLRTLLPIAVHGVALAAALELARERPMAWILVVGVLVSAAAECLAWMGERGRAHACRSSQAESASTPRSTVRDGRGSVRAAPRCG